MDDYGPQPKKEEEAAAAKTEVEEAASAVCRSSLLKA
jgi:hypothetical protein